MRNLAILAAVIFGALASNAEAQLFRRCQPQPVYASQDAALKMSDVIRLNYYMQHLRAQQAIATNTRGIQDEIARFNGQFALEMEMLREGQIRESMLKLLMSRQTPEQLPAQIVVPQRAAPQAMLSPMTYRYAPPTEGIGQTFQLYQ